jgi:Leucine-rich repeat (LRR) protein
LIALTESFREGAFSLCPTLTLLDLGDNEFTEKSLLSLWDSFDPTFLQKITNLDYSPERGLVIRSGRLEILSGHRVGMGGTGKMFVNPLGLAIQSGNFKSLAGLRLSKCLIEDKGFIALVELFRDGATSLLLPNLSLLDLSLNQITNMGLSCLGDAMSLGILPNIRVLDLSENRIGDIGAKCLTLAIRSGNLHNLTELRLQ